MIPAAVDRRGEKRPAAAKPLLRLKLHKTGATTALSAADIPVATDVGVAERPTASGGQDQDGDSVHGESGTADGATVTTPAKVDRRDEVRDAAPARRRLKLRKLGPPTASDGQDVDNAHSGNEDAQGTASIPGERIDLRETEEDKLHRALFREGNEGRDRRRRSQRI